MTLSTIQPIGKKPVTAPRIVARIDMPAGMVKMKIATRFATISAMTAAMCAFTLFDAIRTSSVTTGKAAAAVDSAVLLNGLSTWFHMDGFPPGDLRYFVALEPTVIGKPGLWKYVSR